MIEYKYLFIFWGLLFIFLHKRISLLMMDRNDEWHFLSCIGMLVPSFCIYIIVTVTSPVWIPCFLLYKTVWK